MLPVTDSLAYFDASALVKLILPQEAGADLAQSIFDSAAVLVTSMLSYVEIRSALARRFRNRELDEDELATALGRVDRIWSSFETVSVGDASILVAADLLPRFALSGADAVQIAGALEFRASSSLTFVTWDRRQAEAAHALDFPVQPPID